jgi:cardiolipin synthase
MAWILALLCIPFISVPAFLLFGKRKIENYHSFDEELTQLIKKTKQEVYSFKMLEGTATLKKIQKILSGDALSGNSLKLLLDGEETFQEMLQAIRSAEKYIFLQMYIFRTDRIGSVFAEALKEKSKLGVEVFVLYERLGIRMSKQILKDMKKAGVQLGEFTPVRINKLQLNFRNHRKLLIVDGEKGFFGGINIGDDYLGRYPSIGFWRDSNVLISGPIVNLAQLDFLNDWKYSQIKQIKPALNDPSAKGLANVLLVNSSPSDESARNLLLHIEIINSARERLWIANPYIVPPQGLIDALILSYLKGVDVRILIPLKNDNYFVSLAMNVYIQKIVEAGIRVFRYIPGMMHQKVILVDHEIALIGSSNLDFRSMHINFENTIITDDQRFIKNLESALKKDFEGSMLLAYDEFNQLPFVKKIASRLANSFAPIL